MLTILKHNKNANELRPDYVNVTGGTLFQATLLQTQHAQNMGCIIHYTFRATWFCININANREIINYAKIKKIQR